MSGGSGSVSGTHLARDLRAALALDQGDVILALKIEPESGAVPEVAPKPHGSVGCDRPPAIENVGYPSGRNPQVQREPIGAEAAGLHFPFQKPSRVNKWSHCLSRMVVDDFHVEGIAIMKYKTDAPAAVDRHRPLAGTITLQLVQPNALERTQVPQRPGYVQRSQKLSCSLEIQSPKLTQVLAVPHFGRGGVAPAAYHGKNILQGTVDSNSLCAQP